MPGAGLGFWQRGIAGCRRRDWHSRRRRPLAASPGTGAATLAATRLCRRLAPLERHTWPWQVGGKPMMRDGQVRPAPAPDGRRRREREAEGGRHGDRVHRPWRHGRADLRQPDAQVGLPRARLRSAGGAAVASGGARARARRDGRGRRAGCRGRVPVAAGRTGARRGRGTAAGRDAAGDRPGRPFHRAGRSHPGAGGGVRGQGTGLRRCPGRPHPPCRRAGRALRDGRGRCRDLRAHRALPTLLRQRRAALRRGRLRPGRKAHEQHGAVRDRRRDRGGARDRPPQRHRARGAGRAR